MKFFLLFSFSTFLLAFPIRVIELAGTPAFNDILLKSDSVFTREGVLKTNEKSKVSVFLEKWDVELIIANNSQVRFFQNDEFAVELLDGTIFWKSKKRTSRGVLRTANLIAWPNTNDFFARHNMGLGESEILSSIGGVKVSLLSDQNKHQTILANQWVGAGLRFGNLNDPVIVPEQLFKDLRRAIEINKSE